jgi:hypothetical protein
MIELGQMAYDSTIILSITFNPQNKTVTFDLVIPNSEEGTQILDTLLENDNTTAGTQSSSRKLKTYIARELIALMGGTLTSVADHEFGLHYRIILPLKAHAAASVARQDPVAFPLLIVAHNEAVALSVSDMLSACYLRDQVDLYVLNDADVPKLSHYGAIVVTRAALTTEWTALLHEAQQKHSPRLIVLEAGYERNHSIPEELNVNQMLKLPVLPEEICDAFSAPILTQHAEYPDTKLD